MIPRVFSLDKLIQPGKVLVIYGARRVGKTTLLNQFLSQCTMKFKLDSGDNIRTQQILGSQDFQLILDYVSGYDLYAIDEAQQIPNIGMGLKIIVDQLPGMIVIATGSSSFGLAGAVGEPLTGRKKTINLYPISGMELLKQHNRFELMEKLEDLLVFGSYPDVLMAKSRREKVAVLEEIVSSYLLKDVLSMDRIKGSKVLLDLLKLIAFQVGSLVSLNELATQIKMDVKTVGRYLDIFEKAFVLKRVGGFSRNLRQEIIKKAKYFFLDNGIRNGVVSQFNRLDSRNDIGPLWENYLVTERLKKMAYKNIAGAGYFWRTYDGQEIDWIEEREGRLWGFEFKWSSGRKGKTPKDWKKNYPQAAFEEVTRDNYLDFIV